MYIFRVLPSHEYIIQVNYSFNDLDHSFKMLSSLARKMAMALQHLAAPNHLQVVGYLMMSVQME